MEACNNYSNCDILQAEAPTTPIWSSKLASEEIESLINACKSLRNKAMFAVMYQCGLRNSETSKLKRPDYDRETKILTITRFKNEPVQRIALWDKTANLLDAYLASRQDANPVLFASYQKHGRPLNKNAILFIYKSTAEKIGLPPEMCRPRCLRYSPHIIKNCCVCHEEKLAGKDFPKRSGGGTRYFCKECRAKALKKRRLQLKTMAFQAYGGCECKWCGDDDMLALSIDHINNGGTKHRKEIAGVNICCWLMNHCYPPGFQVLCMSCQCAKHLNGGVLPLNRKDKFRKLKDKFKESVPDTEIMFFQD